MKARDLGSYEDKEWRDFMCRRHPAIAGELRGVWLKTASALIPSLNQEACYKANERLRIIHDSLSVEDFKLDCDDQELRDKAASYAAGAEKTLNRWGVESEPKLRALCARYKVDFPEPRQLDIDGIVPSLRRVACQGWWRRQLRKLQSAKMEGIARDLRIVNQKKQIYCSDFNVNRRRVQKDRNRKILEGLKATNKAGQSFTLQELSDKSVSKPENRRNELMVRIRGFQEVAERYGHKALFVTVTCPSEFHPYSGSKENGRYSNKSVNDGSRHLNKCWANFRSFLARRNCGQYGFRVAEPHHDGTIHYHFLLFVDGSDADFISEGFRTYFLHKYKPNERGAKKYRVDIKRDLPTSAAAGYIAKYISKNIDGHGVDKDLYGHESKNSSQRIEAWASTHRIRQFQQIGGPSVTVWRELRRIKVDVDGDVGKLRSAADAADWSAFVLLMGGPFARRVDAPLSPMYRDTVNLSTGELLSGALSKYGDLVKGSLLGLSGSVGEIVTRTIEWVISWADSVCEVVECTGDPPPLNLTVGA